MAPDPQKVAGAFFFVSGVECIVGIMVAETQYPGYSVANNAISDLGATCVNSVCVIPASATIFNSSVFLLGVLVIIGAYFLDRCDYHVLSALTALSGVGAIGVGLFPETTGKLHVIVSLIVFLFGGLSALASYKHSRPPMSYFSVVLGVVTLAALALYGSGTHLGLGLGGMERMIAYPALAWVTGFGGYLMNGPDQK